MSAIGLVFFLLNSWIIVFISNAEDPALISSTRVIAGPDLMLSVEMARPEGGPTGVLFDSCLAASRSITGSIESLVAGANSIEFVRYALDAAMTAHVRIAWKTLNASESLFTCADAAADAGYPMFKYDNGPCSADNNTFDLNRAQACDDNATSVVFINATGGMPCPYPGITVGANCLQVFLSPSYNYYLATACTNGSVAYTNTLNDYDAVVAALKLSGYTADKLIVDSFYNIFGYYYWQNTSYYVNVSDKLNQGMLYMNPARNFLLEVVASFTVRMAMLCSRNI